LQRTRRGHARGEARMGAERGTDAGGVVDAALLALASGRLRLPSSASNSRLAALAAGSPARAWSTSQSWTPTRAGAVDHWRGRSRWKASWRAFAANSARTLVDKSGEAAHRGRGGRSCRTGAAAQGEHHAGRRRGDGTDAKPKSASLILLSSASLFCFFASGSAASIAQCLPGQFPDLAALRRPAVCDAYGPCYRIRIRSSTGAAAAFGAASVEDALLVAPPKPPKKLGTAAFGAAVDNVCQVNSLTSPLFVVQLFATPTAPATASASALRMR
jgi:hypothetical protein